MHQGAPVYRGGKNWPDSRTTCGGATGTHVSVDAKLAAPSPNINVVSPCNACCLQNRFRSTLKFRGKGAREVDQIVSGQFFPPPSECQEILVLRAIFDWPLRALAPVRNRIPIGLHACQNRNKCCPVLVGVRYWLLFCMGCYAGVLVVQYWVLFCMNDSLLAHCLHRLKDIAGIIRPSMYM